MLFQDFRAFLVPRRPHFILQLRVCDFPIVYVWIGENDMLVDLRLPVWTENLVYVYERKRIRVDGALIAKLLE